MCSHVINTTYNNFIFCETTLVLIFLPVLVFQTIVYDYKSRNKD